MDTKILLISDDWATRSRLASSLTQKSVHVLVIPTEPGALPSYVSQADLIVLDVPRVDMKDFRLLAQIRQLSPVPVIALVHDEDYRVSVRGLDLGADHVMLKPVNQKELEARVRALLRRAQTSPLHTRDSGPKGEPRPRRQRSVDAT